MISTNRKEVVHSITNLAYFLLGDANANKWPNLIIRVPPDSVEQYKRSYNAPNKMGWTRKSFWCWTNQILGSDWIKVLSFLLTMINHVDHISELFHACHDEKDWYRTDGLLNRPRCCICCPPLEQTSILLETLMIHSKSTIIRMNQESQFASYSMRRIGMPICHLDD